MQLLDAVMGGNHVCEDRADGCSARRRRADDDGVRRRQARRSREGAGGGSVRSRCPAAALRARHAAASGRARDRPQTVHRRPRRDGQASAGADRRDVQSHLLFRRPGRPTRRGVRVRTAHGRTAEQAFQDRHRQQGARALDADAARHAAFGAGRGQGRPGCGAGHGATGAAEARRLQRSHPHQRQPDPGHRPRRAGDRLGGRPVGQESARP